EQAAEQFEKAHGFVHTVRVTDRVPASKEVPSAQMDKPIEDAELAVARAKKDLRACYEAALGVNAKTAGTTRMTLKVNANGEVWRVEATSIGLPAETCECLVDVGTRTKFKPPAGGGANIIVPVTFQPRQDD